MANIKNTFLQSAILIVLIALIAGSCVPVEKLSYFNDIEELDQPVVNPRTQKIIKPFDKLYIRVLSIDLADKPDLQRNRRNENKFFRYDRTYWLSCG